MATDIKELSIVVTPKGISTASTQLGKLATNAAKVREPVVDAKMAIMSLNKTDFSPIVTKLQAVVEQTRAFKTGLRGAANPAVS